jgi:hypothetical protein
MLMLSGSFWTGSSEASTLGGGGGALLVDDYDFIQVVRDAVDSFAKSKGITVNHIDSLRGLVLLQKP